jgi:hypothetical protein
MGTTVMNSPSSIHCSLVFALIPYFFLISAGTDVRPRDDTVVNTMITSDDHFTMQDISLQDEFHIRPANMRIIAYVQKVFRLRQIIVLIQYVYLY